MSDFQVIVRVRPRLRHDEEKECVATTRHKDARPTNNERGRKNPIEISNATAVEVLHGGKQVQTVTSRDGKISKRSWPFDRVYGPESSQEDVYASVKAAICSVANGINATIFAYGQTGSGKTYTMIGTDEEDSADSGKRGEGEGIVPRAIESLFDALRKKKNVETFQVRASFLQIYNNKLYDLLCDPKRQRNLALREMTRNGVPEVVVNNATEVRVSCANDVLRLLHHGNAVRAVRGTSMNANSSRSHVIMLLSVEVHCFVEKIRASVMSGNDDDGQEGDDVTSRGRRYSKSCRRRITKARLNLVDLAGSEKWDTSNDAKMGDDQARELTHINSSLSTLGSVIRVLSSSRSDRGKCDGKIEGPQHVPYRESKLTFLLRDALGGNSSTTVIATISPTFACYRETISTLHFATRATRVRSNVRVNEIVDDSELLRRANVEINRLKKLLRKRGKASVRRLRRQLDTLQRANSKLREENSKLRVFVRSGGRRGPMYVNVAMSKGEGEGEKIDNDRIATDTSTKYAASTECGVNGLAVGEGQVCDGGDAILDETREKISIVPGEDECEYDDLVDEDFEDDSDDGGGSEEFEIDDYNFDDKELCDALMHVHSVGGALETRPSTGAIAAAKELELASRALRKIAKQRKALEAKLKLPEDANHSLSGVGDASGRESLVTNVAKESGIRSPGSGEDATVATATIWRWLKKNRIDQSENVARELDNLGVDTASDLLHVTSDEVARIASRMNRVRASRFLRAVAKLSHEKSNTKGGSDGDDGGIAALSWSRSDVNLEVRIFLHRYNKWFSGTIVDYDDGCRRKLGSGDRSAVRSSRRQHNRGMHCVRYEAKGMMRDNAHAVAGRWHDLRAHPVQVVGRVQSENGPPAYRRGHYAGSKSRRRRRVEASVGERSLHRSVIDAYGPTASKSSPERPQVRETLPSLRPSTGRRLLMELEARLGGVGVEDEVTTGAGPISPSRYRA